MPNWTENILSVKKKHFDKFKEVAINKDGEVDFGILLPEPEYVKIDCETSFLEGQDVSEYIDTLKNFKSVSPEFFTERIGEHAKLYKILKDKYGDELKGWYAWRCDNWGTKWNSSESYIDNEDELDDLEDDDDVIISFNTAWSAPEPWYQELSGIIPFETECTEEGGFFHFIGNSDGEGNFTIDDDTEEYFKNQEEDEEE